MITEEAQPTKATVAGLHSHGSTFMHIGDPAYLFTPRFGGGQAQSWYHALREALAAISAEHYHISQASR